VGEVGEVGEAGVEGWKIRVATCPTEEATVVAAVITLEHPLKPASTAKMGTRLERMIVFMTGISKNLLRVADQHCSRARRFFRDSF
jgi:RecA/RadA recombinase